MFILGLQECKFPQDHINVPIGQGLKGCQILGENVEGDYGIHLSDEFDHDFAVHQGEALVNIQLWLIQTLHLVVPLLAFEHGLVGVVPAPDDFAVVLDEAFHFILGCSARSSQRTQQYILTLDKSHRMHNECVPISKLVDYQMIYPHDIWSSLSRLNVDGCSFRSSCEILRIMGTILLSLELVLAFFSLYILHRLILLLLLLDCCVIAFFIDK